MQVQRFKPLVLSELSWQQNGPTYEMLEWELRRPFLSADFVDDPVSVPEARDEKGVAIVPHASNARRVTAGDEIEAMSAYPSVTAHQQIREEHNGNGPHVGKKTARVAVCLLYASSLYALWEHRVYALTRAVNTEFYHSEHSWHEV